MARLLIALAIALFALVTYFGSTSINPLTGEALSFRRSRGPRKVSS